MKTKSIRLDELDKYMELVKVETRVKVKLHYLLRLSEAKLKLAKEVRNELEYISIWKKEYKFDEGIRKLITPSISTEISIPRLRKALGIDEDGEL